MPKTKRLPELENKEYNYVIEYKCVCGKTLRYYATEKPDILIKCFDCLKNKRGI